jgi:hypothetical protein
MYTGDGQPIPKVDFNYVLNASRDAFTIMRYGFQGIPPGQGWLADTIVECTRNEILGRYPGWEKMRQVFPAPSITYGPNT